MSGTFSTDVGDKFPGEKYTSIHVIMNYDYQVNQVLYKDVQLIKDDGESYVYDDEGNLTSAASAAERSSFVHDKKGSITRMGDVDGTGFEYGYDTKNHLTRANNSEGVRYSFTYNDKGQPETMTVEGGKHLGALTPGRIYYFQGALLALTIYGH